MLYLIFYDLLLSSLLFRFLGLATLLAELAEPNGPMETAQGRITKKWVEEREDVKNNHKFANEMLLNKVFSRQPWALVFKPQLFLFLLFPVFFPSFLSFLLFFSLSTPFWHAHTALVVRAVWTRSLSSCFALLWLFEQWCPPGNL